MRPLLSLALAGAVAGSLVGAASAASRDDRYAMQMVRLALSTGRWAEGTVANGVEPLRAYRNMLGYMEAGRDLLPRYELPAGWAHAIDLVLTLPGPVLPGDDEEALDGAEALAITYARASALERALPRRRITAAHASPEAVRRVLVDVAAAVPRGVSVELQPRTLAQGARYVADVAAEHRWAGHPAEADRLRVAASASAAAATAGERLRFLELVLSSHRDEILDGRDLARDTIRAFFEIPGRPDDDRREWQLVVLEGVVLAMVDHLPVDDPARIRLKEAFEDSYDWDSQTRAGHLTRQFWNAGGV